MKVVEYGSQNEDVIMLLHGGGMSWWNYKEEVALLQDKYHVVIPILDGHAGSDRDFISIEENAKVLCDYIKEHFGNNVHAIGGLSLGGQILVEMLSQVPDICKYAIIESALVIPMPFINRMIGPTLEMSYGLIKKRWFAKMQFKQLRMKEDLFEVYYTDTCKVMKENMVAFLKSNSSYELKGSISEAKAKTVIVVGGKETKKIRKSAALLSKYVKGSTLYELPNYYHGELSIKHAREYVNLLERI